VLPAFLSHQTSKQLSAELVVRLFLKLYAPAIIEELVELVGEATRKLFDSGADLFLLDFIVFNFLVLALEALPGKGALDEVYHDEAK
jgi:hypothetical protein